MPLLKEAYPDSRISVCTCGSEARRTVSENDFDIVIVNTPLHDELGDELALGISEDTTAGCILIAKSDNADSLSERLEDYGIMVVARPISRVLFFQSLKLMNASRKRVMGLARENVKLQKKLDEIKIINRAKLVLMQYLKFSENQAHKYIEKQAMDMRTTRYDVAMRVIKTYDLDARN